MKKIFLLLFLLPLFLACCKDKTLPYCEEFPDKCVDVREVKDYFYFSNGSWWIYQEESSGIRDSVYVIQSSDDYRSVVFSTTLYSSYDDYQYRQWATGSNSTVVNRNNLMLKSEVGTSVNRSKGKPGDYVGESRCFLFYPSKGVEANVYGGSEVGYENTLKVSDIYDSLDVFESTFYSVVQVKIDHCITEESQTTYHYYSPKIGLIKKELIDSNQVWNLVDYHIE